MVSNTADWAKRTTAVTSPIVRARWTSFLKTAVWFGSDCAFMLYLTEKPLHAQQV